MGHLGQGEITSMGTFTLHMGPSGVGWGISSSLRISKKPVVKCG